MDAVIEWYTRERYQTLDASRWGDLKGKIDEHREELAKLLRSIGIDENRPQDEAWGWAIRLNEQIRKEWQNCNQNDPLVKHNVMKRIDEMNEKRRMKLEQVCKEDCRVTLLGWVDLKDRKPLSNEAISTVEPLPQQQTTKDASSQQAPQLFAPVVDTDVAMIEATDASTQSNGNNEQSILTTAEDATAGVYSDAMDVDVDLFGDDLDFGDESPDSAVTIEASNSSEPLLEPIPASSQNVDEVVESSNLSLPSAEALIATQPQVISVDSNADHIQAEALPTVPAITSEAPEVNDNQGDGVLGSVLTCFNDDFGAAQNPQVADIVGTGLSVLTEAEEALFEELIDVGLLEQDVQQDQIPAQQEPMLAPVEDPIYQAAAVPQDVPVTANQDDAVVSQATEDSSTNGDFKSSAEWNERPEIPTLDEFLQFMDESTRQQIRAAAWETIHKFVHLEMFHPAQLDVFAFAPPEVQEPMLAEYEKHYRNGGQLVLPLLQSHWDDPEYSARTPMCVNFSNFVVQMYPATEPQPDEIVNEQAQPVAQPAVQETIITSDTFDLDSFDLSSFESSGPIDLEEIVNAFADVNEDQSTSSIEHGQETIEDSMIPDATVESSEYQNSLQMPEPIIVNEPAQARNGAATKTAARGKKSTPAKRKTATPRKTTVPKRKGPDLPLQPPIDESTFGQFEQGDVIECPVTPAQDVRDGLGDWASAWCQRSWSEEDPEPKNRTPAELARIQQLGMNFNQGMHTGSLIPSPNTSASLVGAINDHLSQATPNGANSHASIGVPVPVEQQTSTTPAKRSHRGRPAAPANTLRKTRTRKLKHPESPQKVPSGKYTRRKSKSPGSSTSDSSVPPQQPENGSGQPTVYYEAAPNRRLGLDTSPEDWVAQSTNKRKRAQPTKETRRKAQKTQQPTPVPLQSNTNALNGNSTYRAILPRPEPVQTSYNGMQALEPVADSPEYSHDFMSAPEPMMHAYSSPVQQVAEPGMSPLNGMPPNVPAQASQQGFQQILGGNMMQQHNFQRGNNSSMGLASNGGMQSFKQPMQQPMHAGQDDMDDSDDDSDDEIMRRLRKTERKMKRQEEALRRIAEMEEKMRHNEKAFGSSGLPSGRMMNGSGMGNTDSVDLTQLDASSYQAGGYQN